MARLRPPSKEASQRLPRVTPEKHAGHRMPHTLYMNRWEQHPNQPLKHWHTASSSTKYFLRLCEAQKSVLIIAFLP